MNYMKRLVGISTTSGGSGSGVDGQSLTSSGGGRPHSNSVGSDVDSGHGIMSSGQYPYLRFLSFFIEDVSGRSNTCNTFIVTIFH